MKLFKKKKEEAEEEEQLDLGQSTDINIQVAKLAAKVESMLDIRKSYSEKFSMMSEQIGELRGMILDSSKQIQKIDVESSKAVDLVNEVQPEKFMTQLRKAESGIEAVKAAIESKEAIMKDITEELHKIRKQMSFYRGIEQVQKLNEEIKKDIFKLKKVQAEVERHSDKVESIFIDLQKKYGELDSYSAALEELEKTSKELTRSFDKIKFELDSKAEKKDYLDVKARIESFLSESRLEKVKEFSHNLDNFQKRSKENFDILRVVKQRTDDLQLMFENAGIHQFKMELKNVEKSVDLIKVDVEKYKEVLDSIVAEQSRHQKIQILSQNQIAMKKQITRILNSQESFAKAANRIPGISSKEKSNEERILLLERQIEQLKRKTAFIQKQSELEELKGIGGGIKKLQTALEVSSSKMQMKAISKKKKGGKKVSPALAKKQKNKPKPKKKPKK